MRDEVYEEFPDVKKPDNTAALFEDAACSASEERRSNKVVNIHATTQPRFARPHFEDASGIDTTRTVVMNLESTAPLPPPGPSPPGVAHAGEGKIKRVANSTYIIIQVDLINELESNGLYF